MGSAPLVALAFLAVIGAVLAAFVTLCSKDDTQRNVTGMLCAIALGLLAMQMMIGFPVKKNLGEQLAAQGKAERWMSEPFKEFGDSMAQAVMMQIQIRNLPALYTELIRLGIPALALANGLIDGLGKG